MYADKFIAFVDILGFKCLVKRSEEGGDGAPTVEYILELISRFGWSTDEDFAKYGPTTCPCAPHISKDLNFHLTQISDCAVISAEASPAGLINLVHHCYKIAFRFLKIGHLCRGYITRGNIVHTDTQFFGTGYVRAYDAEKHVSVFQRDASETGTPFIEIDPQVSSYVAEQPDMCVKTAFGRLTESDGKGTAISPFLALKTIPDMPINNDSDLAVWNGQVQVVRESILRLLSQLVVSEATADARGRRKIEHLKIKLSEVLVFKDKQVEMANFLAQPYPRRVQP